MRRTMKVKDLPFDIVYKILCRLPVKSLLRFRCLSNLYRKTIDDPQFIKTHDSSLSSSLLFEYDYDGYDLSQLEVCEGEYARPMTGSPLIYRQSELLCSTRGFLLLLLQDDEVRVCNPSRRESITLPSVAPNGEESLVNSLCLGLGFSVGLGLGFNSSMNEYKIVSIFIEDDGHQTGALLYSSGTKTWRRTRNTPPNLAFYTYINDNSGVFVKGSIYWICYHLKNIPQHYILSFDFETEVFSLAELDFDYLWCKESVLTELGGYLAIGDWLEISGSKPVEKVWLLTEGKWKRRDVEYINDVRIDRESDCRGHYFVNDEGFKWTCSAKLIIPSLKRIYSCKETLVSLDNF